MPSIRKATATPATTPAVIALCGCGIAVVVGVLADVVDAVEVDVVVPLVVDAVVLGPLPDG